MIRKLHKNGKGNYNDRCCESDQKYDNKPFIMIISLTSLSAKRFAMKKFNTNFDFQYFTIYRLY